MSQPQAPIKHNGITSQGKKKTSKARTRHSLIIWFLGAFFMSYQFFLQIAPSVMIMPLAQSFHSTPLGISLLSSAYFYTYIILQIPAGILVDKGNIRWIYVVSLAALAITCLCFALSHSYQLSLILRILMGLFASPGLVSAFYLINRWFLKKYFALFLGLTEMYCGIASAIGQVIVAQGVIHIGWRSSMFVYGLLGLSIAILGYYFIRERKSSDAKELSFKPHRMLWRQIKERAPTPSSSHSTSTFLLQTKRLLSLPQVWIAGLICGIAFAIISGFAGFWCIPLLQTKFHISLTHAAIASATILVGSAACSPLMGILAHKLSNIERFMAIGLLLCALLFLPLLFCNHLSISVIIILLIIMGMLSSVYVLPFALVKQMVPKEIHSTTMGMVNMLCIIIGAPCLVPIIGGIVHAIGTTSNTHSSLGLTLGLSLFPILLIIASLMSFWLAKNKY